MPAQLAEVTAEDAPANSGLKRPQAFVPLRLLPTLRACFSPVCVCSPPLLAGVTCRMLDSHVSETSQASFRPAVMPQYHVRSWFKSPSGGLVFMHKLVTKTVVWRRTSDRTGSVVRVKLINITANGPSLKSKVVLDVESCTTRGVAVLKHTCVINNLSWREPALWTRCFRLLSSHITCWSVVSQ